MMQPDAGFLAGRSEVTGIATFARSRGRFDVLASTKSGGEAKSVLFSAQSPRSAQAAHQAA
jgi:hypothetical protein